MSIEYEKQDYVVKAHEDYKKQIEAFEKKCVPIDLSCSEFNGRWAIFVKIEDDVFLIEDPICLINSVYKDEQIRLKIIDEPEYVYLYVDCKFDGIIYQWTSKDLTHSQFWEYKGFKLSDYQNSVKNLVTQYLEICKTDKPLYKMSDNYREDHIRKFQLGIQQLEVKATLQSHYELMAKDVQIEDFIFEPLEDEYCEDYLIGIGNRCYDTCLSHWDNYFEAIRHQLEAIIYNKKAKIDLTYDMSDTIVTLKKETILKSIKSVETGYGFDYIYPMRVEIESNEFAEAPTLVGFCDRIKVVRSFYEGLLKLALIHPINIKDVEDDEPILIDAYNMFKSPLIENYIIDKKLDYEKPQKRQQIISEIVIISPDKDSLGIEKNSGVPISVDTTTDEITVENKKYTLKGVAEWINEYRKIQTSKDKRKRTSSFDWQSFHSQGMALAQEFRKLLPPDIDIWYKSPAEDKNSKLNTLII
ncbi:MAG: hypothetical protein LUC88_08805 [Prevotella sp.]|nr:hypothetical protein [Prevotella sp.]